MNEETQNEIRKRLEVIRLLASRQPETDIEGQDTLQGIEAVCEDALKLLDD